MPNQKVRFGLTLPNRGAIIGATTIQECIDHLRAFIDAGATTITLRLTGYDHTHHVQASRYHKGFWQNLSHQWGETTERLSRCA
jgi:hypothetical protein